MEPFANINRRLTALEGALRQTVRLGYVIEQIPAEGKVRVRMEDADCVDTFKLPVLVHKTRCDKQWWLPDLGEQVVCVFLPLGLEIGFVLGSFYSLQDLPPVDSPDKAHLRFLDGGWLEYDRGTGEMQVHCRKRLVLAAGEEIELRAPVVKLPPPLITAPSQPELRPVEPSPLPIPAEWPHG